MEIGGNDMISPYTGVHTPAPWIDGAERDGRQTVHYVKAGTCNIYLNRGVGQTEQEARANIRLVAAAPELLEACKAALAKLESLHEEHNRTGVMLEDAIQKATGGVVPWHEVSCDNDL